MSGRPPQLSPLRVLAGVVVPLVAYVAIRALTGSSVGALAVTDAVPSAWLRLVGIARRRVDPIAVLSATTVIIAFAAYVLTGVADQTIRRVLVERAVTIRPGGRRKIATVG